MFRFFATICTILIFPLLIVGHAKALPPYSTHCGPEGGGMASVAFNSVLYPWPRLFDESCLVHDRDYDRVNSGDRSITQRMADDKFLRDMMNNCRTRWREAVNMTGVGGDIAYWIAQIGSFGAFAPFMQASCMASATLAHSLVAEFGADIGSANGVSSIQVRRATLRRFDTGLFGSFDEDEVTVEFEVINDGNYDLELDAVLLRKGSTVRDLANPRGMRDVASNWVTFFNRHSVDVEPDTHEFDLSTGRGQVWRDSVTTNNIPASWKNLNNPVQVVIRADLYQEVGNNLTTPFKPMALIECPLPRNAGSTSNCTVKYPNGPGWGPRTPGQNLATAQGALRSTPPRAAARCDGNSIGIWAFRAGSKFVRGGVTIGNIRDYVAAVSNNIGPVNRSWETFRLLDRDGRGGRYIINTINGQYLQVDGQKRLRLRDTSCASSDATKKWVVVPDRTRRGYYALKSEATGQFVRLTPRGLLVADAPQSNAYYFAWGLKARP